MERVVRRGNGTRIRRGPWGGRPRASAPGPRKSGFTVVELLVVIGVVAILMAIVVPSVITMSRQNRRNTCAAHLKALGQALAIFHSDYGCYPPDSTEYLWTPQAVREYQRLYPGQPIPTDHRLGSLVGAAYHPDGRPFEPDPSYDEYRTQADAMHGLGLYTLYYLGAYASVLPPRTADPRFPRPGDADYPSDASDPLRKVQAAKGYRQFSWFRGSQYITDLGVYHCPANDAVLDPAALTDRSRLPGLTSEGVRFTREKVPLHPRREGEGGTAETRTEYWNNYDQFYRRNFWSTGLPPSLDGLNDEQKVEQSLLGATRNLIQPFPPADTVVTWCPYHHRGYVPKFPGDGGPGNKIEYGDVELVLLVDGSVRRVLAQQESPRVWDLPAGMSLLDQPVM